MGIFSKQPDSPAYVPPQAGGIPTLLGDNAMPAPGQNGDLNGSPATSVELRFRHVVLKGHDIGFPKEHDTGFDHAFIVVTDNRTGAQYVHQASPRGPQGANWFPSALGTVIATTDPYNAKSNGYDLQYKKVASFDTDASPEHIRDSLTGFGAAFNMKSIPYTMPDLKLPLVPRNRHPLIPTPNSNYYGGAAWQSLTGTVPELPQDIDAPGWGDHRLDEDRPK